MSPWIKALCVLACATLPAQAQDPNRLSLPEALPDGWIIPAKAPIATNPKPDAPVKLTLTTDPDPIQPRDFHPDLQPILITATNDSDNDYYVCTMAGSNSGVNVFSVGADGCKTYVYPPILSFCTCPGSILLKARSVTCIKASVPVNPWNKFKKMQLSLGAASASGHRPLEILSPIFAVGELK